MNDVVKIGDATLYHGDEITLDQALKLKGYQRYRLRKKGVIVPEIPRKRGYRQTAEHIEKRIRRGNKHHHWQGGSVSEKGGRARALRNYPKIGPCQICGNDKSERHHIDENTANNDSENIAILCRKCHMKIDGRLDKFMVMVCQKK